MNSNVTLLSGANQVERSCHDNQTRALGNFVSDTHRISRRRRAYKFAAIEICGRRALQLVKGRRAGILEWCYDNLTGGGEEDCGHFLQGLVAHRTKDHR